MKLKEALSHQEGNLISPPPVFDMEKAERAVWIVERGYDIEFKACLALRLALVLSCYNFLNFTKREDFENLFQRLDPLGENELIASDVNNPLPTIGIEVEVPRKPYNHQADFPRYAAFFDTIGMPRNRINTSIGNASHWEFSPPPSFTGAVQTRILCELIKGYFIPSLLYSRNPQDIKEQLDDKLVSLHINLGIPTNMLARIKEGFYGNGFQNEPDVQLFASGLAVSFSSTERLRYRSQNDFVFLSNGDKTVKGGGINGRLEIKALEVNTQRTYRLIKETQLLCTGLFAHLAGYPNHLAEKWEEVREEIVPIFDEFGFEPNLMRKQEAVSILISSTSIGQRIRNVLDRKAQELARILKNDFVPLEGLEPSASSSEAMRSVH